MPYRNANATRDSERMFCRFSARCGCVAKQQHAAELSVNFDSRREDRFGAGIQNARQQVEIRIARPAQFLLQQRTLRILDGQQRVAWCGDHP